MRVARRMDCCRPKNFLRRPKKGDKRCMKAKANREIKN
jgi:hypothetical protein